MLQVFSDFIFDLFQMLKNEANDEAPNALTPLHPYISFTAVSGKLNNIIYKYNTGLSEECNTNDNQC